MPLKTKQKKQLKALAHKLKPAVLVGKNGVTESLLLEISKSLEVHELIKIKFIDKKDEVEELSVKISSLTESELIGIKGNVLILYKENKDLEDKIELV